MKCASCHKVIESDSVFCGFCGYKVKNAVLANIKPDDQPLKPAHMDAKDAAQSKTPLNKYSLEFYILAAPMLVTIVAIWVCCKDFINIPGDILAFIWFTAPFLIVGFMTVRWACKNRDFSKEAFVNRAVGVLSIWLVYLYLVIIELTRAMNTHLLMEKWFYPFAMPWLIPLTYWGAYAIASAAQTVWESLTQR